MERPELASLPPVAVLRRALAATLRDAGYHAITHADPPSLTRPRSLWALAPDAVTGMFVWGFGGTILQIVGVPPLLYLAAFPAGFAAALLVWKIGLPNLVFGLFLLFGWGYGLSLAASAEPRTALYALYIAPFAIASAAGIRSRIRSTSDGARVVTNSLKGGGLVVPLAILFLVVPAGSTEIWQLGAAASDLRLGAFWLILVVPLYWLAQSELRRQIPRVLVDRAHNLVSDDVVEAVHQALEIAVHPAEFARVVGPTNEKLWKVDESKVQETASSLLVYEHKALGAKLRIGLVFSTAAVGIVLAGFFAVVTYTMVDPSVAEVWLADSGKEALDARWLGFSEIETVGLQASLLLGAVATAAFLASIVVDSDFAVTMGELIVGVRVDVLMPLGMVYLACVEDPDSVWQAEWGEWEPLVTEAVDGDGDGDG